MNYEEIHVNAFLRFEMQRANNPTHGCCLSVIGENRGNKNECVETYDVWFVTSLIMRGFNRQLNDVVCQLKPNANKQQPRPLLSTDGRMPMSSIEDHFLSIGNNEKTNRYAMV
jgi:hypothetical protein